MASVTATVIANVLPTVVLVAVTFGGRDGEERA